MTRLIGSWSTAFWPENAPRRKQRAFESEHARTRHSRRTSTRHDSSATRSAQRMAVPMSIGCGGPYSPRRAPPVTPQSRTSASRRCKLSESSRRNPGDGGDGASFAVAAACALGLVGVASFFIADRPATEQSLTTTTRDYAAGPQERAAIELPDGTHVLLAPGSHLKVPADFSRERQVNLDGEAEFSVVHNTRRPFSVRTAQTVTRDVGTAFDLQAYAESGTTRVIVTEGTVDVGGLSVKAGQAAVVTAHAPPAIIPRVHPDEDLGWTRGQLVFDATRVSDAATIISRWYAVDVRVPDSALGARHVTARFTNPSVDQVLASLASTLNVRVDRTDLTITLLPQESRSTK